MLNVSFSAQPLAANQYDYQLTVVAPLIVFPNTTTGLTLTNICQSIGMGDISSSISSAIPVLSQVLTAIQALNMLMSIVQTTTTTTTGATITTSYTFGDRDLSLYIDSLVIIFSHVTITEVFFDVQSIGDNFRCDGKSSVLTTASNTMTIVNVALRTPTKTVAGMFHLHASSLALVPDPRCSPGSITIQVPAGLTTTQVMSAFTLPDLTSVPVIKTVLSIAVDNFECTFGYPPAVSGSGLAVLGASIALRLDDLNLGVLELASLKDSLEYHDQNDPLGPGYEQKAFSIT